IALVDNVMTLLPTNISTAAAAVLDAIDRRPGVYLVGISGIPGSGKTTLTDALHALRPNAGVLPMDGYHLPRSQLDAEGLRRRGAQFTFDAALFRADLERLRRT